MLIRFEVSNFRSIAEPVELSMVAVDQDREEARPQPHLGESLLTVAAVYGPNASGKTNVVLALAWLRDAILDSLRFWEERIPVQAFAFDDSVGTTEFVFESTVHGIRFEYVLELDAERVHYEGLFHYPESRRRRIFEREGRELKLQRGLGGLTGTRELLTDRTLALSIARRFEEPLISDFTRSISEMQVFGLRTRLYRPVAPRSSRESTMRLFDELSTAGELSEERDQALAMLRLADLGIEDVLVDEQVVSFSGESGEVRKMPRIRLLHRTVGEAKPLDFGFESEGTRTWFDLIGPVLSALRNGSLLVFDELDASLHPTLSAELLRIFHSPVLNPRGAQLIFTSHDTSLLTSLNRDEVWLTEKRKNGSTRLGALADFAGERVRKSQNLESAYLHGRFGALPQVDQTGLLRALGLIG